MNDKKFKQVIILLTILLAVAMIIFTIAMQHKTILGQEEQTIALVKSLAEEKDLLVTNTMENWYTYADAIASLCIVNDSYNREKVLEIMDGLKDSNSPYVRAFDADGDVISRDDKNISVADRSYYSTIMDGNRTITDMMSAKGEEAKEEIVAAVVPMILSDGTVVGGIICAYEQSKLENLLSNKAITWLGETIILDKNHRVIIGGKHFQESSDFFTASDKEKVFSDNNLEKQVREGIENRQGNFAKFEVGKNKGLLLYECNIPSDWTIVTFVDEESLKAYSFNTTKSLLMMLSGSTIFSLFLFWIIVLLYMKMIKIAHYKNEKLTVEKQELSVIAMQDSMTLLYNKKAGIELIEEFLNEYGKYGKHALLFIDIDDFKSVNDNFGHNVGDQVIMLIAHTIHKNFRNQDIVSRFGGDEFIVLVKNYENEEILKKLAGRLCNEIFKLSQDEESYNFSASIGIATYPDQGTNCEELVQKADTALYSSKEAGKNQYTIYDKPRKK